MYGGVPPSVPQFSSFFVQDALLRREFFFRICKRCVCICCSCRIHAAPLYCIEMDFTPRTCAEGAYIVYAVPAVLHNAHLQSWVDFFQAPKLELLSFNCCVSCNSINVGNTIASAQTAFVLPWDQGLSSPFAFSRGKKSCSFCREEAGLTRERSGCKKMKEI